MFTRKNYPLLSWVSSNNVPLKKCLIADFETNLGLEQAKWALEVLRFPEYWKDKKVHRFNVSCVTKPFYDAIIANKDKLLNSESSNLGDFIYNELYSNPLQNIGLLLFPEPISVLYSFGRFEFTTRDENDEIIDSWAPCCSILVCERTTVICGGVFDQSFSSQFYENPIYKEQPFSLFVELLLGFFLFKKYAQIETKVLSPVSDPKRNFSCNYVNHSKSPITIYDSTWFTTLIKSDSFKVRGHFRLQPFGPEMKEKRLIWINDFQKDGYTRQAKILSEPFFTN